MISVGGANCNLRIMCGFYELQPQLINGRPHYVSTGLDLNGTSSSSSSSVSSSFRPVLLLLTHSGLCTGTAKVEELTTVDPASSQQITLC